MLGKKHAVGRTVDTSKTPRPAWGRGDDEIDTCFLPKSDGMAQLYSEDDNLRVTYKASFWIISTCLVLNSIFSDLFNSSDADEVVMKPELPGGAWLYVTRYWAFATDLDNLRFYISKPLKGDDVEILQQLNLAEKFLLTDSSLKEVKVSDAHHGIHIEVQGAVYRYKSEAPINGGDDLTSYRTTLKQRDFSLRDPCGRVEC